LHPGPLNDLGTQIDASPRRLKRLDRTTQERLIK
jgi:hypothetical protein